MYDRWFFLLTIVPTIGGLLRRFDTHFYELNAIEHAAGGYVCFIAVGTHLKRRTRSVHAAYT